MGVRSESVVRLEMLSGPDYGVSRSTGHASQTNGKANDHTWKPISYFLEHLHSCKQNHPIELELTASLRQEKGLGEKTVLRT